MGALSLVIYLGVMVVVRTASLDLKILVLGAAGRSVVFGFKF